MPSMFKNKTYLMPLVISGLGVMTVASAQTNGSPFSSAKKPKAWETGVNAAESAVNNAVDQAVRSAPVDSSYGYSSSPVGAYSGETYTGKTYSGETYSGALDSISSNAPSIEAPSSSSNYSYTPPSTDRFSGTPDNLAGATPSQPSTQVSNTSESGAYYPGRVKPNYAPTEANYPPSSYQSNAQTPQSYSGPKNRVRPGSWRDKFGLGNIQAFVKGFLRGGAAATQTKFGDADTEWRDDYIADLNVEAEASAITQGGMEYGFNFEVRSQYDRYRRGFGGRVGDCPASVPGCASDGLATPTAIRGHTSQFYTDGPSNAQAFETAIEGAYIFLRSAYGDVTLGLDDGAAYLFSLGAPSLLAVNASNSPVDYTGLDSVKTVNDASGFAEKITYTSPRLLGDQIGFGVQLGVSYAPHARACGVDYCVRRNGADGTGVIAPDLSDVLEVGASIDRKFDNGLNVEATFTYATAKEDSALAVFDDLQSWNTGLEVSLSDWTVGGSYLQSNNGLADGDYTAWDAGITWKPSKFGVSASYGHAEDENINLTSDQAVFGVTYEFNRFTLGTGVQYIERTVPVTTGGVVGSEKEKATALFVEGGFTF